MRFFSTCLRLVSANHSTFSAGVVAVAILSFSGPAIAAENDEQQPAASDNVDAEVQRRALTDLAEQIKKGEAYLEKKREKFGHTHPDVIRFEKELELQRNLLALQQGMFSLWEEPLDERRRSFYLKHVKEVLDGTTKQLTEQEQALSRQPNQRAAADQLTRALESQLKAVQQQLAQREDRLVQTAQELAKLERRELPALKNPELKVYSLVSVPAAKAAATIETLLGAETARLAVDERTNSLIVLGERDSLPVVDALLSRLDVDFGASSSKKPNPAAADDEPSQSLLLRLFWLADGLPEGEGSDPAKVLPASVLKATANLGLENPRLVSQSVNSLAVSGNKSVEFVTNVPAVMAGSVAGLDCAGKLKIDAAANADLEMHIETRGEGASCQLRGSLATPLGHYMVLGTANTVLGDTQSGGAAMMGGEMRGGYGGAGFAGVDPATGMPAQPPNLSTARFAFVVQVTEADSYYQESAEEIKARERREKMEASGKDPDDVFGDS